MNFKKTLILAVVLLISVVYLAKVSFPAREREQSKDSVFVEFDKERLTRVEVARRPGAGEPESYELLNTKPVSAPVVPTPVLKSADPFDSEGATTPISWGLAKLPGAILDSSAVTSFLSALGTMKLASAVDEENVGHDFSEYGLDKPVLTLVVHGPGKTTTELAFGKKNEYLGQRYVKVSGRPGIHLLDESSFTLLDKGRADLRDKAPVRINDTDVRELVLQSKAGRVKVQQVADGEWKIIEPFEKPASTIAVGDLLRTVKELRVSEFLDGVAPESPAYGLDQPAATLSLILKDGVEPKAYEVKVSKIGPTEKGDGVVFFVHTGAPSVFKTLGDPLPSVELSADKLRERRLLRFGIDAIAKVAISGPDVTPIELVNKDRDGYEVNGKPGDPVFIEQVLENLTSLQATEFPTAVDPIAFKEPRLRVAITKSGPTAETVSLIVGLAASGKEPTSYYAKVGDMGEPVLIAENDYKRIVAREETLLAPAPTPVPTPAPSTLGQAAVVH